MSDKLFIIIKGEYFREILSEIKTEELKKVTPYWTGRIVGREYTHVIFQLGYRKGSLRIECEYQGYKIKVVQHKHFGDDKVNVYAIKLGKPKIIDPAPV